MKDQYLILSNTEDGDVRLQIVDKAKLEDLLDDEEVAQPFLGLADIVREGGREFGWDFANSGARGSLIIKADAVVIPKAVQVIPKWRI